MLDRELRLLVLVAQAAQEDLDLAVLRRQRESPVEDGLRGAVLARVEQADRLELGLGRSLSILRLPTQVPRMDAERRSDAEHQDEHGEPSGATGAQHPREAPCRRRWGRRAPSLRGPLAGGRPHPGDDARADLGEPVLGDGQGRRRAHGLLPAGAAAGEVDVGEVPQHRDEGLAALVRAHDLAVDLLRGHRRRRQDDQEGPAGLDLGPGLEEVVLAPDRVGLVAPGGEAPVAEHASRLRRDGGVLFDVRDEDVAHALPAEDPARRRDTIATVPRPDPGRKQPGLRVRRRPGVRAPRRAAQPVDGARGACQTRAPRRALGREGRPADEPP